MKNILKSLLVPILASRPVAAVAHRLLGCGVPIFMLHRMTMEGGPVNGGITPKHLRSCLQYLLDHGYTFISLQQLVMAIINRQPLPRRAVAFTMDDGYADQARISAPIFREFDCPLTFFVISGMLDQTLWPWDARLAWITWTSNKRTLETGIAGRSLSLDLDTTAARRRAKHVLQDILRETASDRVPGILDRLARDAEVMLPEKPPEAYLPMNWDMARELEHQGVQFAPHSVSHNILSRLDQGTMEREILESWETLSRELATPVKLFCYPNGRSIDFGGREMTVLKRNDFLAAVATTPGYVKPGNTPQARLFNLPRFALPDSMDDFIQYCSWIEYAKHHHGDDALVS